MNDLSEFLVDADPSGISGLLKKIVNECGIKWLENIAVVFILGALAYMFYSVSTKYGIEVAQKITNIEGTWGLPFWGGTTAFLGIYSTMILNGSDYSRELKRETRSVTTGSSQNLLNSCLTSSELRRVAAIPIQSIESFAGEFVSSLKAFWYFLAGAPPPHTIISFRLLFSSRYPLIKETKFFKKLCRSSLTG